ncbi:universal stress protein [Actinoplanes sp. NBRC 101535]|uniref:universal stress protein n=1 Tax=Actinoplanes sp. NBRC 101535 TaxID=3032196 RepID=UPI0024A3EEF6|nr:universal stress protein [Actinoplanes sp. NBRC 101535]GLY02935.1 hypothetical protein Acsp01_33140 [Actinoplanes sp. NBRC 101535]
MDRVIVGVSGSPAGLAALRFAVAEAQRRGVGLWAVRSWQVAAGSRSRPWGEVGWDRAWERDAGQRVAAAFRCALGGVPVTPQVVVSTPAGAPGTALMDAVSGPGDLLVVGAGSRWWGGGVARLLVRRAPCPVLVVPPPALARVPGRRLVREVAGELARMAPRGQAGV